MAQATFSVRMDESLKKELDELCSSFGMTTTTAIIVFAKAVVRERRIPFEIKAPDNVSTQEKALKAFLQCIIRPLCTPNPRSGYRKSNKSVPPVRYCSTAS